MLYARVLLLSETPTVLATQSTLSGTSALYAWNKADYSPLDLAVVAGQELNPAGQGRALLQLQPQPTPLARQEYVSHIHTATLFAGSSPLSSTRFIAILVSLLSSPCYAILLSCWEYGERVIILH
jgi:hypothetical protein